MLMYNRGFVSRKIVDYLCNIVYYLVQRFLFLSSAFSFPMNNSNSKMHVSIHVGHVEKWKLAIANVMYKRLINIF